MAIDPEWARNNPSQANAQLMDNQWELFQTRYRPLEDDVLARYMSNVEGEASRAGENAQRGLAAAQGVSERQLGRRGVRMTADQAGAVQASQGLNAARTVASAENFARRDARDRNLEGLGTMIGIGQGISGSAGENLGTAAGMASQRSQQAAANKAANRQSLISTGLGLGGLAIAAGLI